MKLVKGLSTDSHALSTACGASSVISGKGVLVVHAPMPGALQGLWDIVRAGQVCVDQGSLLSQ